MSRPKCLDEMIIAETIAVRREMKERKKGRPGMGRPDLDQILSGRSRPTSSPLPNIRRSQTMGNLGVEKGAGTSEEAFSKSMTQPIGSSSMSALPSTKSAHGASGGGDDEGREGNKYQDRIDQLQLELRQMRETYNSLRDTHRRLKQRMQSLRDKLLNLKREDDVEENRRQGMEQIEKQRQELDKAKKMLEDTLNYRRTLQHMTTRLKEERLTYDNTLKAYEEALYWRRLDAAELREEAVTARTNKQAEERELVRIKALVAQERVRWEQQIEERRREARKREEQKRWAEEKKRKEAEEAALVEGKAVGGESKKIESSQSRLGSNAKDGSSKSMDLRSLREEVEDYQRAFTEIKLATGLSEVEDIVERFNSHENHTADMEDQIKALRTKVEALRERKLDMQRRLDTIKFSGAGATDFNREMIDKLTRDGDEARRRLKMIREEHEKVEKMCLEIKQSIAALALKLTSVKIESSDGGKDSPSLSRTNSMSGGLDAGGKQGDESKQMANRQDQHLNDTIHQISLIEAKMTKLLEALDEGGEGPPHRRHDDASPDASPAAQTGSDLSNIMDTLISNNKFNVRIRPSTPRSKEHLLLRGAALSSGTSNRTSRPTTADANTTKKSDNPDRSNGRRRQGAAISDD